MRRSRPSFRTLRRRLRHSVLLLLFILPASVASAQHEFPDLPRGHWAEGAVLRMAERGIIVGFPDGTFRGDDRLSRFEAAALVVRLLDTAGYPLASVDEALDRLAAGTFDLGDRLDLLEVRFDEAALDPLQGRLAELEDEVARLRARLGLPPREGARGGAPGGGLAGAGGADGPEGGTGGVPAVVGPGAAGVRGAPGAAGSGDGIFLAAVRPWYLAATIGVSPEGVPIRAVVGHDALLGTAGLRGSLDLSLGEAGIDDAAVAVHVTRRFGADRWSGYLGAGLGYRYDPDAQVGPPEGPFMGAVIGAEYALDGRWGLVFEGTVDHHLRVVGRDGGAGTLVRPGLAVGASYRF